MTMLKPGQLFDKRYDLVKLIDNGGFADVWEAQDKETRNHTVALKIYPMLDVEGIKNIEEEYDVQKDLSHSNLLTVRHFGKDEEGRPYLVMRYCSGGNAASSKYLGKYTELEIAKVMQNVGAALAYLHKEKLVHQDIKPNNILIDLREGQEYIFLADLGLSLKLRATIRKFTEAKKSNTNSIQSGMTPPPYRAAELWGKDNVNKPPIKATDIWALGATLFELITGDVPFGEFGGLNQLSDPTPPNLPTDFKCSNDLNEIIKRCLAKDPWDRPKATELVQWATNFIETGQWSIHEKPIVPPPITPEPIPTLIPSQPFQAKEWVKWAAIIGLGMLGAYGVDTFWLEKQTPPEEVVENQLPEEKENKSSDKTQAVTPLPKDTTKVDENKDAAFVTADLSAKKGETVAPPIPKPASSAPQVDNPPQNANIRITSINRTPNALTVKFVMTRTKDMTDNSSYAIYGTENPQYAFYVRDAARNIYKLKSLEGGTNGQSISWGSRKTHAFTATFEPIPSHIRIVDIREAEERIPGQSYWNFGGVHLP